MSGHAGEEKRSGEADEEIRLRPFDLRDLRRVLEIERESFPRDPYPASLFLMLAQRVPELFLVAARGRALVGYAVGAVEGSSTGRIVSIAIATETRRRGLGRKLTEELLGRLEEAGAERYLLETRVDNEPAIGLWHEMGFEAAGILPAYYADGTDAWLMQRG